MDITKKLYVFDEPYIENNYNQFFNPNICHVCKWPIQKELMPCPCCNMIFYCCEQHKAMHQNSHIEVCGLIRNVRDENWQSDRESKSEEDWKISQMTFMRQIDKITRDLKPYEIEMFMCAKSCLICHQQINLRTCETCYSANYCDEHKMDFIEKHKSTCKNLLTLLNLNILSINNKITISFPLVIHFKVMKNVDNMFEFIVRNIKKHTYRIWQDISIRWCEEYYIYSDYLSGALTLFYAIREFNDLFKFTIDTSFIIHILVPNSIVLTGLPSWKYILHYIDDNIEGLRILLIAPIEYEWEGKNELRCSGYDYHRTFFVQTVSHDEYVSTNLYKQANIIVAFEAEFNIGGTLLDIFAAIKDRTCPFLFTAKSQDKAEEGIKKVQEIVGAPGKYHSKENKFCSCRPYRDYETGGIYFHNTHLVVYYEFD